MIKKLLMPVVLLFLFTVSASAEERIVFVNLERAFGEFYKTQLAKSKMELQQQEVDVERQLMVDEINLISEEVDTLKKEARDITLSQEIRDGKRVLFEERLLDLRDKQKEVEAFTQRRQQQLQTQVARMSQTIMDEVRLAIVEYAKEEGLQAVIDSSTRQAAVGIFIYTHPDVDITDAILVRLNSQRPDTLVGDEALADDDETDEGASDSQ